MFIFFIKKNFNYIFYNLGRSNFNNLNNNDGGLSTQSEIKGALDKQNQSRLF